METEKKPRIIEGTLLAEVIQDPFGNPVKLMDQNMTVKMALIRFLANASFQRAEDDMSVSVFLKVLQAIDPAKSSLTMTERHLALLRGAVEQNNARFPAIIRGRIFQVLSQC